MSSATRVTVVGEVLVDMLWRLGEQPRLTPGGSPANVAVGLKRLGRPASLVTAWVNDPPGQIVNAHLRSTGVDIVRVPSASLRTPLAVAYVDENGSASYEFLATWDPHILPLPADTAILHTGSLAVVVEPGASYVLKLCREVRAQGRTLVVADLNVRPAVQPDRIVYREMALTLATATDVIKASDEDLAWLFPNMQPIDAARALLAKGPRLVVVTQGRHGALALTSNGDVHIPAPQVQVADTVGAGDAFQAALLDCLADAGIPTAPARLTQVLSRCAMAAALNCTRIGSSPPTQQELQSALLRSQT
ncbi:carbohydrate kinase [Streptomyces sp. NPDC086835]|uniref:carbohydrate kinase family protein n=1 Tax=Streptomyces sp. NPDC086835 TaxID=3365761 RepID=UPI00381FBDEC